MFFSRAPCKDSDWWRLRNLFRLSCCSSHLGDGITGPGSVLYVLRNRRKTLRLHSVSAATVNDNVGKTAFVKCVSNVFFFFIFFIYRLLLIFPIVLLRIKSCFPTQNVTGYKSRIHTRFMHFDPLALWSFFSLSAIIINVDVSNRWHFGVPEVFSAAVGATWNGNEAEFKDFSLSFFPPMQRGFPFQIVSVALIEHIRYYIPLALFS